MIKRLYSADVLQAHNDRSIYIMDFNEKTKGYSTAYCPSKLFDIGKNSLKNTLKNLIDLLQKSEAEWSRSITINSFDSYIAPLIKSENLNEAQIRKLFGIFIAQINNLVNYTVSLNLDVFTSSNNDTQPEMDMINCQLSEILENSYQNESHKVVPIINISDSTLWDSSTISRYIKLSYKYGVPHYINYLTGTLSSSHLHNLPDKNPNPNVIYLTHGGVMGNADGRGLVGSVAINLPRAGYLSRDEDEFIERIDSLAEAAKLALEQKRKILTDRLEAGLMPITGRFLKSFDWHSSAICIVGVNEALQNLIGVGTAHVAGKAVTYKILEHMVRLIEEYQEETGHLYTLAAYPSELAGSYMAEIDKEKYPEMKMSGNYAPYYTCSSELPPNNGDDLWDALEHQKKYHSIYTGANVFQMHLKHGLEYRTEEKLLLFRCLEKFGYNSIKVSPNYSICRKHGYIESATKKCPKCGLTTNTYVWVDGEVANLETLLNGLKEANKERVNYDVKNS